MSATCPSGGGAQGIYCPLTDLDLRLVEVRAHSPLLTFPKFPCLMVGQLCNVSNAIHKIA